MYEENFMNIKRILAFIVVVVISTFVCVESSFAIRLKIRQPKNDPRTVVAATAEDAGSVSTNKGTVKVSGKEAQLAVISDDGPQSVILAYKLGKRILPVKKVLRKVEKFCSESRIQAYTGLKGKTPALRINTREEGDIAYFKGKLGKGKKALKRRNLVGLVSVGTDCLPAGNGLTLGLGSGVIEQATDQEEDEEVLNTDLDGDGLLDILDIDTDGDSILNNYDSNSSLPQISPTFRVFSNLKVGIASTVNVNAFGRNPTKEEVDALTQATTLAIEVKGEGEATSELNCGTLSYCSTGGTGQTGNPVTDFPGVAGGTNDIDSDGFGEMTTGGSGDFQLQTNLSAFSEMNAGDSFIQLVTEPDDVLANIYFASLQFAFRSVPAVKSLTLDPAGISDVTTFSYPISNGDEGTPSNCIEVTPNGEGDVVLEYVAWRPQRAGISAVGEADFVDLGNSMITIDIPNVPSVGGTTTGGGPGNCPIATYSSTDTNLNLDGETILDTLGDTDADSGNTVTFRVNITDCLSTNTLDSGEQVQLDLQFKNEVGDNAAQKLCIERS